MRTRTLASGAKNRRVPGARSIERISACLESLDHATKRVIKKAPGNGLEHAMAEREFDVEVDDRPALPVGREPPVVVKMFHWAFDIVDVDRSGRSEEHTSELQSLMRISYAVF